MSVIMSVLFILFMHLLNGAQFLNVTPLFLSSTRLAAASSPAPVIVIVPFTVFLFQHCLITTVRFILSSISNGLLF